MGMMLLSSIEAACTGFNGCVAPQFNLLVISISAFVEDSTRKLRDPSPDRHDTYLDFSWRASYVKILRMASTDYRFQ